jgi:hypothetical protein
MNQYILKSTLKKAAVDPVNVGGDRIYYVRKPI